MSKPFRFIFATFYFFAMLITMSACLDSSTEVSQTDYQKDYVKAQSRQYARGLEQYALQSVHLLTNSANWLSGAYATANAGGVIDLAALGGNSETAEDYAQSGFCVTDPANPKEITHITWFESADEDQFILNGIGKNSTSLLVSEMATRTAENSLAVYVGDNNLQISGTNENLTLPVQCQDFDIPAGSPVLISRMDLPELPADAVTKTEFTTMACEAGKVGHYLLSLNVTTLPNGTRLAGGQTLAAGDSLPPVSHVQANTVWTVLEDNCKDEIILTSIATQDMQFDSIELNMASANNVGQNIENGLNNVNCRQASLEREDEQDDTGQNHNAERDEYDTCSDTVEVVDIDNVGEVRVALDRIESHTTPCGGSPGTFYENIGQHVGTVIHPAWTGDGTYTREVYRHEAHNIATRESNRSMREKWSGVSLECTREEHLHIDCGSIERYRDLEVTDNKGFRYSRTNRISGWNNSEQLTPNPPTNPQWIHQAAISGCTWRRDLPFGCTAISGGQQIQEGLQQNFISMDRPSPGSLSENVVLVRPALCESIRVVTESCPTGQGGNIRVDQRRIFTSNAPGTGEWGQWRTIDRTSTCTPMEITSLTPTLPIGVTCGGVAGSEGGKYCTDGYRTVYDWGIGTIEDALSLLARATAEQWEVTCGGGDGDCQTIPPWQSGDPK